MLHDKIIIPTENRGITEFCFGVASKIHQTEGKIFILLLDSENYPF